ncbi:MAG: hypothetical protein ACETWK_06555 [Candidatus Aminicenantaceae bacterium]
MIELYISWVKGLTKDRETLKYLKNSGIISGIELFNIDDKIEAIKDVGLKVSCHNPGLGYSSNLTNPDFMNVFEGDQGKRLLKVLRESDAPTVGFHIGFSAEYFFKMVGFPDIPKKGTLITDRNRLLERISKNVVSLEKKINEELDEKDQKYVVVETMDYSRGIQIEWGVQLEDARNNRREIEETIEKFGMNVGLQHVTDPSFVKDLLDRASPQNIKPVGFLFDIGHLFITADTKIHERSFFGTIEDYFEEMLDAVRGKTFQLHLNVPKGNDKEGYADNHGPFIPGDSLGEHILELAKKVAQRSPYLSTVTLEMEMRKGSTLAEHCREMNNQAEYIQKQLYI